MPLPDDGAAPPLAVRPEETVQDGRGASDLIGATHEALFAPDPPQCDACGAPLDEPEGEEGYAVRGEGVYLWARGDEIRVERAPLCPPCSAAVGLAAMARWEIEEEEG